MKTLETGLETQAGLYFFLMNTVFLWSDIIPEGSVMVLATSNVLSEDIGCPHALLEKAALGSTLCRGSRSVPCFKPPDLMNWTK